jgi:prephenate dehydratase
MSTENKSKVPLVAFQGEFGAYSDLAAQAVFPGAVTMPCPTFEEVFAAVESRKVNYAIIPIDNSIAGRVADIHRLLPHAQIHIVGEHFEPIRHQLLGVPSSTLEGIHEARSHIHALAQCRVFLEKHRIKPVVSEDTAGSARSISELGDPTIGAVASTLAGERYGLKILAKDIESQEGNTTRFLVIALDATDVPVGIPVLTSVFFRLKSVPAALYKAIGGFATNGINLAKIESYSNGNFLNAEFYVEAEGHPKEERMDRALTELASFSQEFRILGTYPTHPYRSRIT